VTAGPADEAETPIARWLRTHPGVPLDGWANAVAALNDIQSDWAYLNGPLNLPERYDGRHGWWL
jgi:hypothetical protein